jgi:hypothetical protein
MRARLVERMRRVRISRGLPVGSQYIEEFSKRYKPFTSIAGTPPIDSAKALAMERLPGSSSARCAARAAP